MSHGIRRTCQHLLLVAGVFSLTIAQAVTVPQVSASYRVVEKADGAGSTRVRLQIHLVNRGVRAFRVRRMTLWDFSHPAKGGIQNCSLAVPSGSSADATAEFTISRAEYELWQRGARPRLLLDILTGDGRPGTTVLRLDRISTGKAD
jgi:hypothetical protein